MTYIISTERRLRCKKTSQLAYGYKHLDAMKHVSPSAAALDNAIGA